MTTALHSPHGIATGDRVSTQAAACPTPHTGDNGMPDQPMGFCGEWGPFMSQLIQYTTYFALAITFASGMMLFTMIVLDKNRGEAGIATSDHSRIFKWAFGVFIVAGAFTLARAGFILWSDY